MCVFKGIWFEMIHHGLWCQIIHRDWGLSAEMQLYLDNGISSCCDRQDWCWEEVTGGILDDIRTEQEQEWGIRTWAVGEFRSSFLLCTFLSSQHWLPSKTPRSTLPGSQPSSLVSPRPCSNHLTSSLAPPAFPPHKAQGPLRGLPSALSSIYVIIPIIFLLL